MAVDNIKQLKRKLHETEEVLEDERKRLLESEKMASIGVLAAGIAHELGNPLGAIRGRLEMLGDMVREQNMDPAMIEASIERMILSVDHMAKIIRAMRSFSRDGSKDPKIAFNMAQLAGDIVEVSSEKCFKSGIQLRTKGLQSPVMVEGRETEMGQVIVNLINNAFDATKGTAEAWISIELEAKDNHCVLRCRDSGLGIRNDILQKIFDPFYTTKRVGEGTGLGLSICRSIVDDHHGSLVYDRSQPHTCFKIVLPLRQSQFEN